MAQATQALEAQEVQILHPGVQSLNHKLVLNLKTIYLPMHKPLLPKDLIGHRSMQVPFESIYGQS